VSYLKEKEGVKIIVAVGFCFGGWAIAQLSRDNLINAVVFVHPSILNIPTDIENIKHVSSVIHEKLILILYSQPSLWICAEIDQQVSKEKLEQIIAIFSHKPELEFKYKVFPGETLVLIYQIH
jgi:dienelactone hydrolase